MRTHRLAEGSVQPSLELVTAESRKHGDVRLETAPTNEVLNWQLTIARSVTMSYVASGIDATKPASLVSLFSLFLVDHWLAERKQSVQLNTRKLVHHHAVFVQLTLLIGGWLCTRSYLSICMSVCNQYL